MAMKDWQTFVCTKCKGKVKILKSRIKDRPLLFCPYCGLNTLKVVKYGV